MAGWGGTGRYFVETQMTPATRDVIGSFGMRQGRWPDYYPGGFLADMQQIQPRFFVDAIGRFWDAKDWLHDEPVRYTAYEPLREYISENYTLAAQVKIDQGPPVLVFARKK